MFPHLEINGRVHIPADEAAQRAGLSPDYIGQLARRGVLPGQLLAGAWYLDRESVLTFIAQRAENGSTEP
jgi:hypothetical protein